MANLVLTANWGTGIYQLETNDPVLGGPEGISNRQARELGNRTVWLRQQIEASDVLLAMHMDSRDHPAATTSLQGMVALATSAEALAGANSTKAVTPAGLAAAVAARLTLMGIQRVTSSGVWTTPVGTRAIVFDLVGGGGGGGSVAGSVSVLAAGSGGGGGNWLRWVVLTPVAEYAIAIGAGGTPGAAGGATSVAPSGGAAVAVNGGAGGAGDGAIAAIPRVTLGGFPGSSTGATPLLIKGHSGGHGLVLSASSAVSGGGGASGMGYGGGRSVATNSAGDGASHGLDGSLGAGGSGAVSTNAATRQGGLGGNGYVDIWLFG